LLRLFLVLDLFWGPKLAPRAWCLVAVFGSMGWLVCVGWLQSLFPRWVRSGGPGAPGLFPVCYESPVPAALASGVEGGSHDLHMFRSRGSNMAAIRPEQ
jgi:hypothetical protein